MASMPEHRKRNTFTSYVAPLPGDVSVGGIDGSDEWCLPSDMRDVHLATPRLLPNELVVASAPAYLYTTIAPPTNLNDSELDAATSNKEAIFGLLSVTNFKLSFVPLHSRSSMSSASKSVSALKRNSLLPSVQRQELYQENLYLQRNDVTLNNIDLIYQLGEGTGVRLRSGSSVVNSVVGGKRKKLIVAQQKAISGRIAALHIICKNFRLLKFAFPQHPQQQSQSSKGGCDYGRLIASALARFVYPNRHDLSFAYCYREPYYSTLAKTAVTMYTSKNDWARELIRCGATEWQVISSENIDLLQNKLHASKYTLPQHFVIPKSCSIERYLDLTRAFCDSRAAFWVYGYGNASLVRLAELKPMVAAATAAVQDNKVENIMLELVRKCDEQRQLTLLQLTDRLPSIQDVQRAYTKFRRLCTPETPQQFLLQDAKFLSLLEKTNWLFYVSLCLRYACEAATSLRSGITCVLQESNGRDLCCIISSLAQIILDPLYRTIDGFQSLVQKEWIALEHPFQRRLGHIHVSQEQAEEEESPVFLIFLDCVWQLLQQFPDEFEYSQTYLTTLWDSCFLPHFDTFQFDTMEQRNRAVSEFGLVLRPVWDWSEQFAEKDKVFFTNPFYQRQRNDLQPHRRSIAIPAGAIMLPGLAQPQRFTVNPQLFITQSTIPKDRFLMPQHRMSELSIWEQCYYRWMPLVEIKQGGFPQIDFHHRLLLNNIAKLQRCLELQDWEELPDVYYEITGEKRCDESEVINKRNSIEIEMIDGVERRRKSLPVSAASTTGSNTTTSNGFSDSGANMVPAISSFFPFGLNAGEMTQQQLIDILTNSNEFLLEGSIMERLSIT